MVNPIIMQCDNISCDSNQACRTKGCRNVKALMKDYCIVCENERTHKNFKKDNCQTQGCYAIPMRGLIYCEQCERRLSGINKTCKICEKKLLGTNSTVTCNDCLIKGSNSKAPRPPTHKPIKVLKWNCRCGCMNDNDIKTC